MSADRKSGPLGRASRAPATQAPNEAAARQGAPVKRFRVETWKVAANGFRLYQCYSDEGAALHVKEQLEWVGARVRIVRG